MAPPLEGFEAPQGETGEPPDQVGGDALSERIRELEDRVAAQQREIEFLSRREHQLAAIIHSTPAVIYMKDVDGRYRLVNKRFSELFHISIPETVGRTDSEIFPADMAARFRQNDVEVLTTEQPTTFEEEAPHDDGPHTYISLKVPLRDPITNEIFLCGISTDITAAKRAESALKESQSLYASLVDNLPVAMFRKNLAGELTFVNDRFCQYIGRSERDLQGRTDYDLFSRDLADKYRADDMQVAREETVFDEVEEQEMRTGQRRYVHVIKAPVYDALHRVVGIQGVFWDETERRQAEEALRRMALELARSNKELENFAYVASHDLQEPLRKVIAYGARAMGRNDDAMDGVVRECLERMVAAANRMKTMIDDLLVLAQVTTERRPFEWIDLNVVARDVLEDFDAAIEGAGASVHLDRLPVIEADPVQMRQLFQNLIGNALKYRRPDIPPRLEIHTAAADDAAHGPTPHDSCELRFVDNGRGFDPRYSERIFEPFERLHATETVAGSGIGLALCRRIVERHDGRITAHGAPNEGATIIVTLPLRQSTAEAAFNSALL
jgi:PAS domain S-box-containing protein